MHHYTADWHLRHRNILTHTQRPFGSVEEMDAAIIARAQARVKPTDDLWVVGDVGMARGPTEAAFAQIPGRKHLVLGNHDIKPWVKRLGWASIHDLVEVQDGDTLFVLCHYPMITWNKARYGTKHLFGHIHTAWLGSNRALNVGVDWWTSPPPPPPPSLTGWPPCQTTPPLGMPLHDHPGPGGR